jgi:hypothetical protein
MSTRANHVMKYILRLASLNFGSEINQVDVGNDFQGRRDEFGETVLEMIEQNVERC